MAASLQAGQWVVLEIDVHGRQQVLKTYPEAVSFFVRPESLAVLEQRLRDRGTENEDTIARRLEVARQEWPHARTYTHEIINHSVDQAVDEICHQLNMMGNQSP